MSEVDFTNIAGTSISTPASGVSALFVDTDKRLKLKDDAGFTRAASGLFNFSTTSQGPSAATRTYITGSKITVPPGKLQIGSSFRWRFNLTKTGAGTAASTFDIAIGTNGTTGDTAIVSFTKPAGTAVIDEGWIEIEAICRGPLSASCIMVGEFLMTHNLSATGHAQIPNVVVNTVSSGFDATIANLFVGVCITSGTADVVTIQQIVSEAWNI